MQKPFYITTTLPYVNASPHVGFAAEIVRADIIARYKKATGHEVFFNTGVDEHGTKLYQAAREAGKDVQAYVDEYAEKFRGLKEALGLHDDIHFIRTTDPRHMKAAQAFWRRCNDNGYIYKKEYEANYCVGCELEKTDSELVNGRCPLHPARELEIIREENYFFAFSKFQDRLLELYRARPDFLRPDFRQREIALFVARGLQDFSISRLKSKMPWGVSVPDDDSQVMYVWFDALVNYISTLGWPDDEETFNRFWRDGTPVQYAGKDNLRQQGAMWQAMLMAAGLPLSHTVVIGGFITSEGQKMSKSLGNVIDPIVLVEKYGSEVVRHFLAQHVHPFDDTDFTMERFKTVYNADLVDGLGNLVARVMKMAQDHLHEPIGSYERASDKESEYEKGFEMHRIDQASDHLFREIRKIDLEITEKRPFTVIKTNPEQGRAIMRELVGRLAYIARRLEPFMPQTALMIQDAIRANKKPENLFPRKE